MCNTPDIRFFGFDDEWKLNKLSELASFSKGKGYSKADLKKDGYPIIMYGSLYTDYNTVIEEVNTFTRKKENSIISEGQEVIVPASGETPEDISRASVIGKPNIIIGGDLNIIKPSPKLNSTFLALTISNGNQKKELSRRAQGKSVVHIRNANLKKVNLMFPSIQEQKKIGDFFRQFDETIKLNQHALDLFKKRKKAFLQKMFPKKGESVPEIRFAGFTGDWKSSKLGHLASFSKGKGYKKDDLTSGGTPIILYGQLYTQYNTIVNSVNTYVAKTENSIISRGNEVIVPASGETAEDISRAAVITEPGIIIGGDLNIIEPSSKINSIFLAITISSGEQKKELSRRAQGKSVVHIGNLNLKNVNLLYPIIEEQKKIGNFFKVLDNSITLQEEKLKSLKQMKKAFLQKMFV